MNSQVKAGVGLAADPVLTRRDDLLDDASVAGRLGELLRPTWGDGLVSECTRIRAKYRPGQSLRATYRVGDGTSSLLVSGRMFPAGAAAGQFVRARDAAVGQGGDPNSVLLDEETSTVFWVFPQDRKLRGLGQLTSPPPELRTVFGKPWVHSQLMAYTPEKAATVRCSDEDGETVGFAKVQTGDEGQRSVDTLRAAGQDVTGHGALLLPRAVGYLRERHLALFTVAPGRPLNQLERAAVPEAMAALGAALSVLHGKPTRGFAPFTRLDPGPVADAGRLVGAARPDLAALCGDLVGSLLATPPPPRPAVLLHGDLHPKNVLVHEAGVSLVDLDQAGTGPAAAELGGTLARLWCPRPGDAIDGDTAVAAGEALLSSYDRRPAHQDLLWYAAAALLVERAVRAISRVDVAGIADLERVLTTALRWAASPGEELR
jgi:hypothetical protein